MKELARRVKNWVRPKETQDEEKKNGSTWYVVQFDYRYPREGAIVVTLTCYGNTANVIDQYYRMGWAFTDAEKARNLAKKLNDVIKPFFKKIV